ncbi:hypothetical protein D621_06740 [beta proteobacterium AAP51]|nr:hypothetical protein D621_06740 [beta proteobacterium AAP51]
MNRIWPALLPELKRFPSAERDQAVKTARQTPLEALELAATAAGLVAVTALTKLALNVATSAPDLASRLEGALLNFAVALPMLVAVLGPVHLRRVRRGLRDQLTRREGA